MRNAREILLEEIAGRPVDLALAGQALLEAERSLLPYPMARWSAPVDPWTHTVIALAAAVRRLEAYTTATRARQAVRIAIGGLRHGPGPIPPSDLREPPTLDRAISDARAAAK